MRRIELWSVLKISLFLYLCLYVAVLIALAVLWGLAYSTGSVDKVQSFLADVGLDNFRFYGDQMFRACAAIGGVLVLAATLVTVVTVALVNLISEVTGGIRLTVIEEDIDDRPRPVGCDACRRATVTTALGPDRGRPAAVSAGPFRPGRSRLIG